MIFFRNLDGRFNRKKVVIPRKNVGLRLVQGENQNLTSSVICTSQVKVTQNRVKCIQLYFSKDVTRFSLV